MNGGTQNVEGQIKSKLRSENMSAEGKNRFQVSTSFNAV